MIQDCKKRQNWNKRFLFAHVASTNEALDQSIQFSAEELARFYLYQESMKSPSTPIIAIAKSSNPNKCFITSSSSLMLKPQITGQVILAYYLPFSHNLQLPLSLWMDHSHLLLCQTQFFSLHLFLCHLSRVYQISLLI